MKPRTLILVAFTAILAVSAVRAEPAGQPPISRVVLIGAHWCAPCRAELPELGALAAAAGPARVMLGWIDRKPVLPPASSAVIEVLPVAAARNLVSRHGIAARGVPFAVAYAADGKPCTVWRGPLTPADWPTLTRQCAGE